MKKQSLALTTMLAIAVLAIVSLNPALAEDKPGAAKTTTGKPLKVYILAGQSNMQGQARARTIDAMRGDAEVDELYKDMTDQDGKPIAVEGVHIVYGDRSGQLDANFGASQGKIGPEYAFGITMKKALNEPILLIKTAWGGKNLCQQFRPPSAGDFEKETDKHGNKTGHFYREMIKGVKEVLADPGKHHPDYDKDAGYEIAGLVWFQGYNDMYGPYPATIPGYRDEKLKDFTEYSRLLACLIRDVRKDLSAPEMRFVIGAIGIYGYVAPDYDGKRLPRIARGGSFVALQRAQVAPASMPEFKGNVAAVYTAKYWDHKLAEAAGKLKWVNKKMGYRYRDGVKKGSPEAAEFRARYMKEKDATEEDEILCQGVSDGAYHYLGSAKIYSRIGKAFAEAMIALEKK